MSARAALVLALGAALAFAAASCGSARRGEPIAGPLVLRSESEVRGQKVFYTFCNKCHPGGDGGLGPALNNKPLPTFLKKYQVRHGLGAMPSFSEDVISDQELDDLMHFLSALRERGD